MTIEPGITVGGKYKLEALVQTGGMSSIWSARHSQLGALVAIKFMDKKYADDATYRVRFEREARAAATLKSPHIVQVHDFGLHGNIPYLVMELLHGEDLHTRLQSRRQLPIAEAGVILMQTGKALRKAHEMGLIHRDLKPRNIYLARVDDEEVVKVLDFGIAKDTLGVSPTETRTGEILGTPNFMSPEQFRGNKDLDARSDAWSLAVILFRAVTGMNPFGGSVLSDVTLKLLVEPIPKPTEIVPDLPVELDAFFEKALARDRDQRFQSVREMVEAFAKIAGLPIAPESVVNDTMAGAPVAVGANQQGPATLAATANTSGLLVDDISLVKRNFGPRRGRLIAFAAAIVTLVGAAVGLLSTGTSTPPPAASPQSTLDELQPLTAQQTTEVAPSPLPDASANAATNASGSATSTAEQSAVSPSAKAPPTAKPTSTARAIATHPASSVARPKPTMPDEPAWGF